MPRRISVDHVAEWAAQQWIGYQEPNSSPQRKAQILPATKYNMLIVGLNASTVLLAMAVASAILFSFPAAVTFGSIALFSRHYIDEELKTYTLPPAQPQIVAAAQGALQGVVDLFGPWVRHSIGTATEEEKNNNIYRNIGGVRPATWTYYELEVFGHLVWGTRVSLPAQVQ